MMRIALLAASILVLPLAALLFLQWPLRDLVQAYSRQANDIAQIVFAVYMAVAITAASRASIHLAAGRSGAQRLAPWRKWAMLACVGPWAAFMLWTASVPVLASLRQFERFSETATPGFFLIKFALWVMMVLILAEALCGLRRRPGTRA